MSVKRRKRKRTGLKLIAIIVFMMCGLVSYKKIDLDKKSMQYKQAIQEYNDDLADLEQEAEDIKELHTYVQTKGYIEQMAREKLGLVYEDEIIFEVEK